MDDLSFWSVLDNNPIKDKTIKHVLGLSDDSDEVVFVFMDGTRFRLHHHQDCCERVYLEDFEGKTSSDFEGATLLEFEVATQDDEEDVEVRQWTFYKVRTTKQDLTLRWVGSSNGYYSVEVHCAYEPKQNRGDYG